jgi:hypothetical protein
MNDVQHEHHTEAIQRIRPTQMQPDQAVLRSQGYGSRYGAILKKGYHTLVSLGPVAEAVFPEG